MNGNKNTRRVKNAGRRLLVRALAAALLLFALALTRATRGDAVVNSDDATPRPELVLQTGHAMRVDALAFSPDSRLVASGSADNTVRLWDAATGRELRSLAGHKSYVRAVAFSPDGRTLASGSIDGSVRRWDVATGQQGTPIEGVGGVISLAFSPDGRALAAGTLEGEVKLLDAAAWKETRTLAARQNQVASLAFSSDGRTLASGGKDGSVKLWEAESGRETLTLAGHAGLVKSVAFSPDGQMLASASFDGTVKVWKTADGAEARTLRGFAGKAVAVAFTPDGRTLLAASSDRSVRVFDAATWNETRAARGGDAQETEAPSEVAVFSAGAKMLATSNGDKTVQLRDLSTDGAKDLSGAPGGGKDTGNASGGAQGKGGVRVFESYSTGVYATAFSPDGRWFATGNKDKTIRVWEIATGRKVRTLTGHTGWVTSLAFSPDSRLLASASLSGAVKLWDNETGREARTLNGHTESVNSVAFSPDGRTLATASGDSTVKLWDVSTGQNIRTLYGHTAEVNAVAFNPDGKTIASGGADKTVKLWDAATGKLLRELKEQREVFGLAFSPDGSKLAVAKKNGPWSVYDYDSGSLSKLAFGFYQCSTWITQAGDVRSIAFSPDGKRIAAGTSDGSAGLWDAGKCDDSSHLTGHTDAVNSVAFSPDGAWLATGSEDGSARIWDARTGVLAATLVSTTDTRDWLVVAPDGLFDGTPSAWSQILWRFDRDTRSVAPVEVFFNEFFYPDLLADILAGKRPRAPQEIARIDRRQPQLKISLAGDAAVSAATVASRKVKIKIDVTDAPAGAQDLRLFRNGSLVYVKHGAVAPASGRASLEAVVPVVAGENRFTAYAFNRDDVKSTDASLVVNGADSLKRTPTTYVLAVGLNEYANRNYNLKFAAADATDFVEEVKRQRARVEPAGRVEVVTLLDRDATKQNIETALRRLSGEDTGPLPAGAPKSLEQLKAAEPEDVVVFYFAGHGTAQRKRFYLIPYDLGYAGERELKSAASLQTILDHSINDEELERLLEPLSASQIVLVIDACNSGQALEAEERRRGPMNSKGLAQLAYEKGMYVLTAAQSYQAANEAAQLGHGLLTYALVEEGLKKGEAEAPTSRDGQIVVRDWFDYAAERVPLVQLERMRQARGLGLARTGEQDVQRPRSFYRRETDTHPLVVARVEAARSGQ
jgi:WD40 repeat protein